jgi:hypothetical protein
MCFLYPFPFCPARSRAGVYVDRTRQVAAAVVSIPAGETPADPAVDILTLTGDHNALCGGDPFPMKPKHVIVHYQVLVGVSADGHVC